MNRRLASFPRPMPALRGGLVVAALLATAAHAEPDAQIAPSSQSPAPRQAVSVASEPPQGGEIRKYCTNIAVAASDARFAYQTGKLNEVETRIKTRIVELEAKAAELRGLIDKREAIEKKANEKLVGIYAKMRPETAATQISMLDDDMAAAVLSQLTPRQASAIFNEIVPERAGKLAGLIAGLAPSTDKKL